jgi:hypothetical protein
MADSPSAPNANIVQITVASNRAIKCETLTAGWIGPAKRFVYPRAVFWTSGGHPRVQRCPVPLKPARDTADPAPG